MAPPTWGTMLIGLADPTEGIADLEAWRLVAAANPPPGFGEWVRLRAADGGQLLADLVLFPSRADAVVASEAAIASQLENARARAGRLVVFYPDPGPFVADRGLRRGPGGPEPRGALVGARYPVPASVAWA